MLRQAKEEFDAPSDGFHNAGLGVELLILPTPGGPGLHSKDVVWALQRFVERYYTDRENLYEANARIQKKDGSGQWVEIGRLGVRNVASSSTPTVDGSSPPSFSSSSSSSSTNISASSDNQDPELWSIQLNAVGTGASTSTSTNTSPSQSSFTATTTTTAVTTLDNEDLVFVISPGRLRLSLDRLATIYFLTLVAARAAENSKDAVVGQRWRVDSDLANASYIYVEPAPATVDRSRVTWLDILESLELLIRDEDNRPRYVELNGDWELPSKPDVVYGKVYLQRYGIFRPPGGVQPS